MWEAKMSSAQWVCPPEYEGAWDVGVHVLYFLVFFFLVQFSLLWKQTQSKYIAHIISLQGQPESIRNREG